MQAPDYQRESELPLWQLLALLSMPTLMFGLTGAAMLWGLSE